VGVGVRVEGFRIRDGWGLGNWELGIGMDMAKSRFLIFGSPKTSFSFSFLLPSCVRGLGRLGATVAVLGGLGGGGGELLVLGGGVVVVVVVLGSGGVAVLVVGGGGLRGGLGFSADLIVAPVQALGLGAVKVEPPIADEVLLVEDGSVGAEEGLGGQAAETVRDAHVEGLALGVGVGVVSSFNLSTAVKVHGSEVLLSEDGVVSSGLAGDGLQEPVQTLVVMGLLALGLGSGGLLGLAVGRLSRLGDGLSGSLGSAVATGGVATLLGADHGDGEG